MSNFGSKSYRISSNIAAVIQKCVAALMAYWIIRMVQHRFGIASIIQVVGLTVIKSRFRYFSSSGQPLRIRMRDRFTHFRHCFWVLWNCFRRSVLQQSTHIRCFLFINGFRTRRFGSVVTVILIKTDKRAHNFLWGALVEWLHPVFGHRSWEHENESLVVGR